MLDNIPLITLHTISYLPECAFHSLTITFGEVLDTDLVLLWRVELDFVLRFERHSLKFSLISVE